MQKGLSRSVHSLTQLLFLATHLVNFIHAFTTMLKRHSLPLLLCKNGVCYGSSICLRTPIIKYKTRLLHNIHQIHEKIKDSPGIHSFLLPVKRTEKPNVRNVMHIQERRRRRRHKKEERNFQGKNKNEISCFRISKID